MWGLTIVGALLILGGERRAVDQPLQVAALVEHRLHFGEVLIDLVELVLLACQIEKRRGVTPRNT